MAIYCKKGGEKGAKILETSQHFQWTDTENCLQMLRYFTTELWRQWKKIPIPYQQVPVTEEWYNLFSLEGWEIWSRMEISLAQTNYTGVKTEENGTESMWFFLVGLCECDFWDAIDTVFQLGLRVHRCFSEIWLKIRLCLTGICLVCFYPVM